MSALSRSLLFLGLLWLLPAPRHAFAQQPAEERIIDVSGPVQQAIDAQVRTYKDGGRPAVLRLSDALLYPFGLYQPVLTCAVLRACIIALEEGEVLISLIAGDDQRWLIEPSATGAGGATPLISVKPTNNNITTNLVVSTDRRVYHLTLDSPPKKGRSGYNPLDTYTRQVSFYYPAAGVRSLEAATAERERRDALTPDLGLGLGELSYAYRWHRDKRFPWEPLVVFDDGARVFIKLPEAAFVGELPLLTVGARGAEQVMNYDVRDGFFVVDGLFTYARLVLSRPARPSLIRRRRQVQAALHIRLDS